MLIATLFAGQHTSSITSSWTGLTMIQDKVRPGKHAQTLYSIPSACRPDSARLRCVVLETQHVTTELGCWKHCTNRSRALC